MVAVSVPDVALVLLWTKCHVPVVHPAAACGLDSVCADAMPIATVAATTAVTPTSAVKTFFISPLSPDCSPIHAPRNRGHPVLQRRPPFLQRLGPLYNQTNVEVVANTARSPPRIRSPFAGRSRSRTRSGGNAAETAPP